MTSRARTTAITVAVLAALLLVFVGARAVLRADRGPMAPGTRAPSFSALALESPEVTRSLADYRGYVVLVNIWATWCAPCRVEMPSMQALHEAYRDRGLRIVAVSVDDPGTQDAIREFADSLGLDFEILHDPSARIRRVYHTTGVPETVVIARDGTIRKRTVGAEDWNSPSNRALIERLLEQPAG